MSLASRGGAISATRGSSRGRGRGALRGSSASDGAGAARAFSKSVRFNLDNAPSAPRGSSTPRGARGTIAPRATTTRGRGSRPAPRGSASAHQQPSRSGSPALAPSNASYDTRYSTLKVTRDQERAEAIKNGFLADPDKPRSLADAITPVGTCNDMCPEFERLERIIQKDVWAPEMVPSTVSLGYGKQIPDEARMVKKFRRSAAGVDEQLPSDLRPPHVLRQTVDYLLGDVIDTSESFASVHHFIWDRTRAIRNDFSIQQVTKVTDVRIAMECYERVARFHILSLHQMAQPDRPAAKYDRQQDKEQLDKALFSLMQLYDDNQEKYRSPNEPEFRSYCVIIAIQTYDPFLEDKIQNWPSHVLNSDPLKRALQLYQAAGEILDARGPLKPLQSIPIAQQNWERFWKIVGSSEMSYLSTCCAEMVFNNVRKTALHTLWNGFRIVGKQMDVKDFTVDVLMEILAFDTEQDVYDFGEGYGFVFGENDDNVLYLDLNSLDSWQGSSGKVLPQYFSQGLVERKRCGRTLAAVLQGMTVTQAQQVGLVREDDGDATMNGEEEDQDSLFVPEAKPSKPSLSGAAQAFAPSVAPKNPFGPPPPSSNMESGFGEIPKPLNPFSFTQPTAPQNPFDVKPSMPSSTSPAPLANPFGLPQVGTTPSNPFAKLPGAPVSSSTSTAANPFAPSTVTFPDLSAFPTDPFAPNPTSTPSSSPFGEAPKQQQDGSSSAPEKAPNEIRGSKLFDASQPLKFASAAAGEQKAVTAKPEQPRFSLSSAPLFSSAAAGSTSNNEQPNKPPLFDFSSKPTFAPSTAVTSAPQTKSSTTNSELFTSQLRPTVADATPPLFAKPSWTASDSTPSLFAQSKPAAAGEAAPNLPAVSATAETQLPKPAFSGFAFSPTAKETPSAESGELETTETSSTDHSRPSTFTLEPAPFSAREQLEGAQRDAQTSSFSTGLEELKTPVAPSQPSAESELSVPRPAQIQPQPRSNWKQRKGQYLMRIAEDLFQESESGLYKQLIDYVAGGIVSKEMKVFEKDQREDKIAMLRYTTIARKWGKIWNNMARVLRLKRQGRERRARVLAEREARAEKRTELGNSRGSSQDFDEFKRSQDEERQASKGKERVFDQSRGGAGAEETNLVTPDRRTSIRANHQRSRTQPTNTLANATPQNASYRVSKPSSAPKLNLRHAALNASMQASAALPFSDSLFGDNVLPAGTKIGTMKNNYFKLKAMGVTLTSDEEDPSSRDHRVAGKKRSYDDDLDTSKATKRRVSPAEQLRASSIVDKYRHLLDRNNGTQSDEARSATSANVRIATGVSTENEELLARLRKVKDTMAESESWFKTEREREEERQTRSSSTELRHSLGSNNGAPLSVSGYQQYQPPIGGYGSNYSSLARRMPAGSPPRSAPKFWARDSFFVKREDYGKTKTQRNEEKKLRQGYDEKSKEGQVAQEMEAKQREQQAAQLQAEREQAEESQQRQQAEDDKKRIATAAAKALEAKGEDAFVGAGKAPATAAFPTPFAKTNGTSIASGHAFNPFSATAPHPFNSTGSNPFGTTTSTAFDTKTAVFNNPFGTSPLTGSASSNLHSDAAFKEAVSKPFSSFVKPGPSNGLSTFGAPAFGQRPRGQDVVKEESETNDLTNGNGIHDQDAQQALDFATTKQVDEVTEEYDRDIQQFEQGLSGFQTADGYEGDDEPLIHQQGFTGTEVEYDKAQDDFERFTETNGFADKADGISDQAHSLSDGDADGFEDEESYDEEEDEFDEDEQEGGYDEEEGEEESEEEDYRADSAESLPSKQELQLGGNSVEDAIEL